MKLLTLLALFFLLPQPLKANDLGNADFKTHLRKDSMTARCVEPWKRRISGTKCKILFQGGRLSVDSSPGITADQVRHWSFAKAPPGSPVKFFQIIYLNSENKLGLASFGFDHEDAATGFMASFLRFLNHKNDTNHNAPFE